MIIYGTFNGFENHLGGPSKFKWCKLVDDAGNSIKGFYVSPIEEIFTKRKMKFGERYLLVFNRLNNIEISEFDKIKLVNKNPRCDIFRKFKNEFHIINGKYKGKRDIDIPIEEMNSYCIWLAKHSNNEATIINSLSLLKKNKIQMNG